MKFVCLGYMDESKWDAMSESERNGFVDACFTYDEELQKKGHAVGGEALQSARNGATIRYQGGRVSVTDGPFVETKEQLGGFLFLEANDLNHAIQLLSKHPSIPLGGSFEIRPTDDLSTMMEESAERRRAVKL
jgi:hypothetical protein